jgi:hypothetical protein
MLWQYHGTSTLVHVKCHGTKWYHGMCTIWYVYHVPLYGMVLEYVHVCGTIGGTIGTIGTWYGSTFFFFFFFGRHFFQRFGLPPLPCLPPSQLLSTPDGLFV